MCCSAVGQPPFPDFERGSDLLQTDTEFRRSDGLDFMSCRGGVVSSGVGCPEELALGRGAPDSSIPPHIPARSGFAGEFRERSVVPNRLADYRDPTLHRSTRWPGDPTENRWQRLVNHRLTNRT